MEVLWMIAGITLGAVVAYLAASRGRPGGIVPEVDQTLASRVKTLEADVDRLRLDFQDTLDKISHLYDRIRKRITTFEPAPPINGPEPTLTGKAAIRARVRAAGGVGGLLKP